MPNLKIYFEFLCAFVPPKPFSEQPKSCWVVLPNFTSSSNSHFPVLLYDRDYRAPDEELQSENLIPVPPGQSSEVSQDKWDLLQFAGEELEIRPDGKPLPDGDSLNTSSSLDTILRIARAKVGMEIFDQRLIFDNDPEKVSCRLLLRKGTLGIGKETEDAFGVFNLDEDSPLLHSQKMAQQVVLTLGFEQYVDLVFRKLGAVDERRLRLMPTISEEVDVTIRNCEAGRIWERPLPPYEDQFDNEINLFFTLSKGFNPETPPPTIFLRLSQDGPQGICAPKAFDGWA